MRDYLQEIERPLIRGLLVLPLLFWLVLYTTAPYFPLDSRPAINVRTLYEFDIAIFHYLPSTELAKLQCAAFDVAGAIAYTLHSGWPFVFLAYMVFFKRRDLILPYMNCFGLVCFLGLITQLAMPTAPPWWYYENGFKPATYSTKGNPAGLARVDERFHIQFYKNMFDSNPVVFGSFPSLHVAWPTTTAFFVFYETTLHRGIKIASWVYVGYVSLAIMYLQHHYGIDVLGGLFYAFVAYKLLCPKNRPPNQDSSKYINV